MKKDMDAFDGAISRTGNQTAKMGVGEYKGGGRGAECVNKKNPYGPGPLKDDYSNGGTKPAASEEDY